MASGPSAPRTETAKSRAHIANLQERAGVSHYPTFTIPSWRWRQDALAFETGVYGADNMSFSWLPRNFFGSNMQHKARNPASCDIISYKVRPPSLIYAFLRRFLAFFMLCFFISLFHRQLESHGLQCRAEISPIKPKLDNSLAKLWAESLITTGACFLLAQGLYGYVRHGTAAAASLFF